MTDPLDYIEGKPSHGWTCDCVDCVSVANPGPLDDIHAATDYLMGAGRREGRFTDAVMKLLLDVTQQHMPREDGTCQVGPRGKRALEWPCNSIELAREVAVAALLR